jgi:hypothetical protein
MKNKRYLIAKISFDYSLNNNISFANLRCCGRRKRNVRAWERQNLALWGTQPHAILYLFDNGGMGPSPLLSSWPYILPGVVEKLRRCRW